MTHAHLARITADLCEPLAPDDVKRLVRALKTALSQLAGISAADVLAIGEEWEFCNKWDPHDFYAVPKDLSRDKPVVTKGSFMYVWGDDGESGFYWKLRRRKPFMFRGILR